MKVRLFKGWPTLAAIVFSLGLDSQCLAFMHSDLFTVYLRASAIYEYGVKRVFKSPLDSYGFFTNKLHERRNYKSSQH